MKLDVGFIKKNQVIFNGVLKIYHTRYFFFCIFFLVTLFSVSSIFNYSYLRHSAILVVFIGCIYIIHREKIFEKEEVKILKKITSDNNGVYNETVDLKKERSAMFRQGISRFASKEVCFKNNLGQETRFFDYFFVLRLDKKNIERRHYKVFAISGFGFMPHMYLNYKRNLYSMSLGQKLSLPSDFEKEFELSIPPSYHLEALQIFTPDIIHEILELPLRCDIEFVDDKILFFFEAQNNVYKDYKNLNSQISGALKVTDLLRPKFENLRWAPVGDKSHYM